MIKLKIKLENLKQAFILNKESKTNNMFYNLTNSLKKIKLSQILIVVTVLILALVAVYFVNKYVEQPQGAILQDEELAISENEIYINFLMEIFDKIKDNYWRKMSEGELVQYYKLIIEQIQNEDQIMISSDKKGLEVLIDNLLNKVAQDKKQEFTVKLAGAILNNLEPVGRNGLYSKKDEENLMNMVQNIDPSVNLYESLGVGSGASVDEIDKKYKEQQSELTAVIGDTRKSEEERSQAKDKLALVERAYETLSQERARKGYDETGAEATVIGELVHPDVFYLKLKRFSPQTFDDFQQIVKEFDKGDSLNSLILDLRGNIGGSIDLLQYFLGPFIGLGNYAFEFFHQDEYTPFKTLIGWIPGLVRYKKVVILVDSATQSSAEVMAAALKKYNVGVVLGVPTKGWGTVERVFELENQISENEKYSMFLVHSLTLRDDNQPIEGRGVDPIINLNSTDWKNQFKEYFNSSSLLRAVESVISN